MGSGEQKQSLERLLNIIIIIGKFLLSNIFKKTIHLSQGILPPLLIYEIHGQTDVDPFHTINNLKLLENPEFFSLLLIYFGYLINFLLSI